jgi:hypothetical protein
VLGIVLAIAISTAFAITAVQGSIKKLDSAARTIVVKAADGTEYTFHFVGSTVVHGTGKGAVGAKDGFRGLKEGSEVVVHFTAKGSEKTAEEVDHIGKDGLKTAEGTVTRIDRPGKALPSKLQRVVRKRSA